MPSRERSVLHVLPHAGGGGDTYVDVLRDMAGYTFKRVYVAPKRKPGVGDLVAGVFDLRRVLHGYDLLHVHGEGAAGMFLPLLALKRSVTTLHGLHLLRRATGVRRRAAELNLRAIVGAADRTICVSVAERDILRAATGPAGVREQGRSPQSDLGQRQTREEADAQNCKPPHTLIVGGDANSIQNRRVSLL